MKLIATAFLAAFLCLQPANAAVCMNHKNLLSFLFDRYSEVPVALGLVEDRGLMEVYVSNKGTWTIVMTTTQGIACIIAAGDTWEALEPPPGPEY